MTFKDPEWSHLTQLGGERENPLDILAQLSMFDTLTPREVALVKRIVHRRRFAEGEMIATPRSGLFIAASGNIHVVQRLPDGGWSRLKVLRKGEWIGEIVPLEDSLSATSILAVEQSEVIGFFQSDLDDLLHTQPKVGFKIIYRLTQMMACRMQWAMTELRNARLTMKLENPITTTEEDIAR